MSRPGIVDTVNGTLDAAVRAAHRLPVHPYFVMSDLAVVGTIALAFGYRALVPSFSLLGFALAFAATQVVYQGLFLQVKKWVIGERARSFVQDSVLVVLPTYLGLSVAVGIPLAVAADFAAMALPLVLSLMRIGCFTSGCCYGVPAPCGVYYPRELLRAIDGWRRFTPGPYPGQRVLPIQLVEAVVNAALFAALVAHLAIAGAPDGRALPTYFAVYASYRIVAENYRGHRHRPKRGRFSESQWACAIIGAGCVIGLALW